MAEDTEYIKLPLQQRLVHKLWKARVHGYTEAIKIFQEEEEKSAVFATYQPLISKFVSDSNVAAQEKGLEATLHFIQNSALGPKTAKEVIPLVIVKCMGAAKKGIQDLAHQIVMMYVEVERQDVVVEELIKGLEHKNPKIVAACLTVLTSALNEFGPQVITIKPLVKPVLALVEDRDKTVRDKSKGVIVEIYRWIGEAIKPQLSKLSQVQMTELETEFAKLKGERAAPTRFLKSQQAKQAKSAPEAVDEGDGDVAVAAVEIDPLSLVDAINVLEKIPSSFFTKIEAAKWQERKEAVEELDKILDYPKFEKGEFGDLMRALLKVVTKDSNVVVIGFATKCIARLAAGLKKNFHPYASNTLPQLLMKFKEKKANVVNPLREAVDAVYMSTTLEAIQEDVIASLDNKNPQIKGETAAFIARCFAQCTPTILNKKILKTFSTALLKTLNEPDPSVRDSSAEALGTAMKVVGEKALLPFLPDIDPLKLAKIKECCEKAEVKVVAKAAPKPEPAKVEPKKVLSGGAVKAQAAKVTKSVSAEPMNTLSDEEIEQKAAEYFPEADVLTGMVDSTWNNRLVAIEVFQNKLMCMDPSEVAAEVMTKLLMKKPGLKDNNFQVMKLKLDCVKYLAEKFPMKRNIATMVVDDVTENLADPKNGTLAGETLMALAEATNLDIVGSAVFAFAFSQRSVKVQQEAFKWANEAIQDFGLIIKTQTVVDFLKKGLNSTNSGVKQSAAVLAGIVCLYQPNFLQRLDEKPAAVALVQTEIENNEGEEAREPTRTCKIPKEPEPVAPAPTPAKVQRQRTATQPKREETPVSVDDEDSESSKKPTGRIDISAKITEQLLSELADKNWKVRDEALKNIQNMVTDTKIKSSLGELPQLLVQRFVDTNSKLVVTALEVCTALATAMGPGSKNHVRTFARAIFNGLGDNKQWVRTAAITCLNTWAAEAGAKEFFCGETIPDVLKTATAQVKIELWNWLSEVLANEKGLPKDEVSLLIPHLYSALEDRNAEVRKAGNASVYGMMLQVGYQTMAGQVEKLKPASKPGIMQILDKVRPDVPVVETKPLGKPKLEVKGKMPAPKSAVKTRASIAPSKPVARKKEEEVDTSPLLGVNKLKNQRMMDEQKLKIAKWNFTSPRPEMVEILRDQMSVAGVNKNLIANMFHQDFKFHLKAIESLSDDLGNEDALISNLDLILKWLTLRFFDTNPSVLLKGLEYLQSAFTVLTERGYQIFDLEANSFVPYLVMKIGDPKDAVRDRVHSILRQFGPIYSPTKLFNHLMEGLKSKNSRLRAECLEELGLLIETNGTQVCSSSAMKEISKQISDRDNSVRSAALNAIVKAYFHDGEKILKQIGQLSEKDMSYLEERIKRTQQNRARMDVTKLLEPKARPEPVVEPMEEPELEPEPEPEMEPEPEEPVTLPSPKRSPGYQYQPYRPVESPRVPKLNLIEIDDSFLDTPVYVPDSIREKLYKPPPPHPLLEEVLRNVASEDTTSAIEGLKKLHALFQKIDDHAKLEPYSKQIFDALVVQMAFANTVNIASQGAKVGQLYKALFCVIGDIFEKKTNYALKADEQHLKIIIREMLTALLENRTAASFEGGLNTWIVAYISRIIEHSDTNCAIIATVNLLFDIVAQPPKNPKVTDMATKCLLKILVIVRNAEDLETLLNLDKVLYTCHLFLQAYPRHSWKDRPSDLPLKAIKTMLVTLINRKGEQLLTHMRSIEDPISSELAVYLKKLLKQTDGGSKTPGTKIVKAHSGQLSEIFKKIAEDGNGNSASNEGLIQLYEFKKLHPDVDLSVLFAPTSDFFKNYVTEGLKRLEVERGPLKRGVDIVKSVEESAPSPAPVPPEDPRLLPQFYLDRLRHHQAKLGMATTVLPDFPPISPSDT